MQLAIFANKFICTVLTDRLTRFQESWCHDEIDINCFSLPNYTRINSYRRLTAHGGLTMYMHVDFAFKEINEKLPITHTHLHYL